MQTATVQARITNPVFVVPDAMSALQALEKAIAKCGVPAKTLELVNLRASPDQWMRRLHRPAPSDP